MDLMTVYNVVKAQPGLKDFTRKPLNTSGTDHMILGLKMFALTSVANGASTNTTTDGIDLSSGCDELQNWRQSFCNKQRAV